MLALHQTVRIPNDHILRINVPNVAQGEEVEVLVLSKDKTVLATKLALMANASNDPLYQSDMNEAADDFRFIDSEHI